MPNPPKDLARMPNLSSPSSQTRWPTVQFSRSGEERTASLRSLRHDAEGFENAEPPRAHIRAPGRKAGSRPVSQNSTACVRTGKHLARMPNASKSNALSARSGRHAKDALRRIGPGADS